MTLVFLLLLLITPYLALSFAARWIPGLKIAPAARARVGLSVFFTFTSIGHFIRTEEMSAMLPHFRSIWDAKTLVRFIEDRAVLRAGPV